MSTNQILLLGAIAGFTIFLGLPAGRLQRLPIAAAAFLSAVATGILLFLLWDVLSAGVEPVESALTAASVDHTAGWGTFIGYAALFTGCFLVGMMSHVYFDRIVSGRKHRIRSVGAAAAI